MPFTPLHMGAGLAIKGVAGRHFSLLTFAVAQVAMDFEPLIGILRGADVLHGPTHTYLAALLIALVVTIISPPICRPLLRRWNHELTYYRLSWLTTPESWQVRPVALGAFLGTMSHVMLDSVMHTDISPLAPWTSSNSLWGSLSIATLHQGCVISGLAGLMMWVILSWLGRRRS